MSCERNLRLGGAAALRNGIMSLAGRYLSTLGSWGTYRDLVTPEQLPERLGQITGEFFKVSLKKRARFGRWLGQEMKAKALSQKDLAQKVSVTPATVARWLQEKGRPGPKSQRGLARALDLPVEAVTDRLDAAERRGGLPFRIKGLTGAILAVHALEQATGLLATTGMRLLARGRPIGQYRGVILRQSPLTPRLAGMLDRLTGGRLQKADGFYFFKSGRTWHAQSLTVRLGDTARTLTQVRSFSLPHREFYFDRQIPPQEVVDVVLGDRDPDTIPGYIGGVNELENLTSLGHLKRITFAASWFLVDETERDAAGDGFVDYDALLEGRTTAGGSQADPKEDFYRLARDYASTSGPSTRWPSTRIGQKTPRSYGARFFKSGGAARGDPDPATVKERVSIRGQQYPIIVKRVSRSPITGTRRADAEYHDGRQWREIDDDRFRQKVADAVDNGQLPIAPEERWPVH